MDPASRRGILSSDRQRRNTISNDSQLQHQLPATSELNDERKPSEEIRKVTFSDGTKANVPVSSILHACQGIHSAIGHGGGKLTYLAARSWFDCKGLHKICNDASTNCVCQLIKPIVGGAAYKGSFKDVAKSPNDIIYIDTWDPGVDGILNNGLSVRKIQIRLNAFTGRIAGTILEENDASNNWNAFKTFHLDKFGHCRIVHTDQGSEYKGVFTDNITGLGIHHQFSNVARGQSNARVFIFGTQRKKYGKE